LSGPSFFDDFLKKCWFKIKIGLCIQYRCGYHLSKERGLVLAFERGQIEKAYAPYQ
jgi:hypothetical protein